MVSLNADAEQVNMLGPNRGHLESHSEVRP
jgi:hypothetical protein